MWHSKRWLSQHCTGSHEWSPCSLWPTRCWCLVPQWLQENFHGGRNVSVASRKKTLESISLDKGFRSVKKLLENNHKNMWTSVEVYSCYTECVGLVLSRQGLVAKLGFEFRNDLVILFPGLVNILVFRTHIADILKFCEDDKENSQDVN